jgi:hypothetical protein
MLSKSLKYCKWSELNSVNSEIELSQTKWTQLLLNCKIYNCGNEIKERLDPVHFKI